MFALLEISCKVFQDLTGISNNNLEESWKKILARFLQVLVRFLKDLTRIVCQDHARIVLKDSYMIHTRIFKDLTSIIS